MYISYTHIHICVKHSLSAIDDTESTAKASKQNRINVTAENKQKVCITGNGKEMPRIKKTQYAKATWQRRRATRQKKMNAISRHSYGKEDKPK